MGRVAAGGGMVLSYSTSGGVAGRVCVPRIISTKVIIIIMSAASSQTIKKLL